MCWQQRRRGSMYAMFWVCMLRYGVASLRAKGLEEDGEYSQALFTNTHAAMAEDMYLLRPILVYKPKDLNRDWSPRFSTLRDKNGWIRAKTA